MEYLGFDLAIAGTVLLRWTATADSLWVSHLYIAPDANHENVDFNGLSVSEHPTLKGYEIATRGTPLTWFSAERGKDGAPGQPLVDEIGVALTLPVGASIVMGLGVGGIYGSVRVRGVFCVSRASQFQFIREQLPGVS